jgi:hypothetical protein
MADGQRLDDEPGPAGRLDREDDALLLRLFQLKHGGLTDRKSGDDIVYEHAAIDEAQDLAAVDLKVLLESTTARPQRCVTVAGDSAQRLVFDNEFHDWRTHLHEAGHDAVEVRPLKLSYRSTAEVMRFARAILGPLADPDEPLVARNGAPVELHRFGELGEAAGFLADALRSLAGREPTASVAVIARHPEQARPHLHLAGPRRGAGPAPRAPRGLRLHPRRRCHRRGAGEGARVRLRAPGRRQRRQLPRHARVASPPAHRGDARGAPALAGGHRRAVAAPTCRDAGLRVAGITWRGKRSGRGSGRRARRRRSPGRRARRGCGSGACGRRAGRGRGARRRPRRGSSHPRRSRRRCPRAVRGHHDSFDLRSFLQATNRFRGKNYARNMPRGQPRSHAPKKREARRSGPSFESRSAVSS